MILRKLLFLFMLGFVLYSCQKEEIAPSLDLPDSNLVLKADEKPLDAKTAKACQKQFEGKCFRGETAIINPDSLVRDTDVEAYCSQSLNQCSLEECMNRVLVLLGRLPDASLANPCLSEQWTYPQG